MAAALISIIGPPAVGKTTTARWLAEELGARLILEDYAGNPFLAQSYLGRREWALPAQLYFLFSRLSQLSRGSWPDAGVSVSDYGFCQDGVYAGQNLSAEDMIVYRRLAGPAAITVKPPDVLIYLDGSESILLERISRRGREYERAFGDDFLGAMRSAYRELAGTADCPVLALDIARADLLAEDTRAKLLAQVREALP